jgi:hypothetical protein
LRWLEYMDYHYFHYGFWERFWDQIPECHLDTTLPSWRNVLTMRMPCFITRDVGVIEDDEGDYVSDYEEPYDVQE